MREPETKTHAMRALIALRKKIINGELSGGTRLYEVPLAEELEISRTPLRDAMSRLAEEGLLDRARHGGFVVRRFTYADVVDAIELRGVLEGTSVRLAAERGAAPGVLEEMTEAVEKIDAYLGVQLQDVDFEGYSEQNARFHDALSRVSGSETVSRALTRSTHLPFASPSAFLPDRGEISAFKRSLRIAQEQHRGIVSAIAAREGARAEALAREHARIARANLEYVMVEEPSLIEWVPGLAVIAD